MDSGAVHIQGDIMDDHMPWIQVWYIFKGIIMGDHMPWIQVRYIFKGI